MDRPLDRIDGALGGAASVPTQSVLPRVARDIGFEDGSKSAFDPRLGHLVHSDSAW